MSATAEVRPGDSGAGEVRHMLLPDAGEGLTEAEILGWRVGPGDEVRDGDVVVEVETAKAVVELPCPFSGTVAELLAAEGETVAVGAPILAVGAAGAAGAAPPADPVVGTGRQAVLVGYGPRAVEHSRRRRRGHRGRPAAPAAPATPAAPAAPEPTPPAVPAPAGRAARALAKPPVRKLAKDLGISLEAVPPTGAGGIVTRDDVLAAHAAASAPAGVAAAAGAVQPPPQPPGEARRIPVRGVRRATAQAMVASAFTAPHVTEWVQVDVTESMALLERLRARRELRELRLTPLTLVARAVCLAVRRTPEANSSWDEQAGEIVVHPSVNLGIAAATDRGLVVPVLPGAEQLDVAGLARAVAELVEVARAGKLSPAQLSGGTLSITNVGVFGVDGGTPILPPGQTVIVSVGQVRRLPWVVGEQVVPRSVATIAISFDHRVIDGESGSRFLSDVAAVLEDPGLALAWA